MNLNNKTHVLIISHFTFKDKEKGAVFPQSIRNFLIKKSVRVTYIDHPFPSSNFPHSQMRIYENGTKVHETIASRIILPAIILFAYQFFINFYFLIKKFRKYDLCIACDNLSFFSAYILRKLGIINMLIYYTVDYSPKRYENSLLNSLYQYLDKLACRTSDINWVAVEEIISVKVQNGLYLNQCAPFQIVPIGFSKENIVLNPQEKVNKFSLVFVGLLFEKQGLQLVIQSLPKLIIKYPKISLTIIGSGPFESRIKELIKQQKLESRVKLTGYIDDNEKIVRILTDCGIGLATYDPTLGDYSYAADPSKIKLYLLCGLPVLTTRVPPIAREIEKRKAGVIINYTEDDLIKKLDLILKSNETYVKLRKNAIEMAKDYDNDLNLNKAFKRL